MNPISTKMGAFYKNKKILVTGGTGSIGKQLVHQLLNYDPKQVIVYSRDDSKQYLMQCNYAHCENLHFSLGNIRDLQKLEYMTQGMDLIFHTAALKQVPICENNPFETINTNIIGSENVIKAAIKNQVKKVINISTDKAINPMNILGATKLISEKLFFKANSMNNNKHTQFSSVRFGNVFGSRGSVVPLFINQATSGNPITVTDLDMTRFFMTIPQAVDLTLKAAFYSNGGETFILKMDAIRIKDLAEVIQSYYNGMNEKNLIPIKMTGIRPGEKIYEELLTEHEISKALEDDELFVLTNDEGDFYHFKPASINSYRSDQVPCINKEKISNLFLNFLKTHNKG